MLKKRQILPLLIIAFFVLTMIAPLIKMLSHIATVDVIAIITSKRFINALINSLLVSTASTVISVVLAIVLAWLISQSNIKFKNFFIMVFTLPMLIPSISHGIGIIVLYGQNGVITNILGLKTSVYGFIGITLGSVMYSYPVAFIMVYDIFGYEDKAPYAAADVLGIPQSKQFFSITIPYLRKPLIAVIFAVFTMVITDYGVPTMVGGLRTTLSMMMYQDVIGQIDFGKGSVIGLILLIPAIVTFLVDMLNKDKGNTAYVFSNFDRHKSKLKDLLAYIFCVAISIMVLLPIITFSALTFIAKYPVNMRVTFHNIAHTFNMNAGRFLANSIIVAIIASIFGVAISFATAYFTARMRSKFSRILHLVSIASLAIPGLVLGLSYAMFFSGSFIYGTVMILIIVNLVHFFASPYLMLYNTMCKTNENLEAVGATLGIPRIRIILAVILPQSKDTIIEMVAYFFVNSIITISAVAFLFNTQNKPISLMITNFEGNRLIECAAFVSVLILVVNLCIKILAIALKGRKMKLVDNKKAIRDIDVL